MNRHLAPTLPGRPLLCAMLLVAFLAAPASAQDKAKPLRWGADEEGGAPYIFPDPDRPGQNKGFEVDLAELLAKELNRPIVWKHAEFKELLDGLRRGDFDLAMNGLEVTPGRLKHFRMSRPYYVYRLQLALRRSDPRFGSLQEMIGQNGVTVGTLEGTAAAQVLEQLKIPRRIYPGQTELYKELLNKNIDGVYIDTIIHAQYLPAFPDLRLVGPTERQGYYGIAFRKEDEQLATEFDQALDRLSKNGALERLYRKWKIWNDDQELLETFRGYKQAVAEGPEEQRAAAEEWPIGRYLPLLLDGAGVTILLTLLSMALAVALGLPIALGRLYGPAPVRWFATLYVEFFRGIPVLLLLYFLYYGLSDLSGYYGLGDLLKLSPLTAAVLGFGLNYAAYEAEIYRAAINGVPPGQWEAATVLGMRPTLTFRRIILPQALRSILPPMTNDFVALFKDTSVVSIIAVTELSKQYQILSKTSFKYIEIGLVTAALYLVMSVPLGYLSRRLEKRWGKHGVTGL
ncbi:MAG TPA: ABC transporter substrate-binding protein/permease [Gemmataceae bacterium]|nr:ABC transporter substrate-binding protein/permease [Gemmataceae bacterium]